MTTSVRMRLYLTLFLMFGIFLSSRPAAATQVVALSLEEIVKQSDAIVLGSVTARQSRWGDEHHRWMLTDYTLAVEEVVFDSAKGSSINKSIVLTYWGGTIGGETQAISEVRLPVVRQRLLLMLRPGWQRQISFTPTVGLNQGLFIVDGGETPRVQDGAGRPLVLETGQQPAAGEKTGAESADRTGVELATFMAWLRNNIASIKAVPSKPRAAINATEARVIPLFAKTPTLPTASGPSVGAVAPLQEAASTAGGVPAFSPSLKGARPTATLSTLPTPQRNARLIRAPDYSSMHQAHPPIVVNNFPPAFSPWSPEDQYQMSKWNYYDSNIFRVYATPTGTYSWPDGVFDLAGWPSSADLQSMYGMAWDAVTIGVTFLRYDSSGWILEADIALNPAFSFTLDDEWVYDGGGSQGFRQVLAHELGHMHGLEHEFNSLSLMNYMPSAFRFFGLPYADDAQAIRAEYPASSVNVTDLAVYLYLASGYQYVTDATYPSSVNAGGSLTVTNYDVENVGTTTISTPTMDWYLTSTRNYLNSYYWLGTSTFSSLAPFTHFTPSSVQQTFTVPTSVPTGDYYLGAYIPTDGGASQSGFPFSNNYAFSRRRIHVTGIPACSTFQISPSSVNPSYLANSQIVTITGSPTGCQGGGWTAAGNGSWITALPTSGSGSGFTTISWAQNALTIARSSSATVAGKSFTVNQGGAPPPLVVSLDFNGDGKSDILWRNYISGTNALWLMNGAVKTSTGVLDPILDPGWKIAGVGDFNGDGQNDILWRHYPSGNNAVWYMIGSVKTSVASIEALPDASWRIEAVADFDGDGKPDILWRNYNSGTDALWLMNGATKTSVVVLDPIPDATWKIVGAGDFNGDGKTDIVWRNYVTGTNAVWLMNGTTKTSVVVLDPIADPSWKIEGTGDFNGDGKTDILWRNYITGTDAVWLMNGTVKASVVVLDPITESSWKIQGIGEFDNDGSER